MIFIPLFAIVYFISLRFFYNPETGMLPILTVSAAAAYGVYSGGYFRLVWIFALSLLIQVGFYWGTFNLDNLFCYIISSLGIVFEAGLFTFVLSSFSKNDLFKKSKVTFIALVCVCIFPSLGRALFELLRFEYSNSSAGGYSHLYFIINWWIPCAASLFIAGSKFFILTNFPVNKLNFKFMGFLLIMIPAYYGIFYLDSFTSYFPLSFILLPIFIAQAVIFDIRKMVLSLYFYTILAIFLCYFPVGPFLSLGTVEERLISTQFILLCTGMSLIVFSVSLAEARDYLIRIYETEKGDILTSKLMDMGLLLAGVTHEINNNLSSQTTKLEIMRDELEYSNPANLDNDLRFLEKGMVRIKKITNSIRALSRTSMEDPKENIEMGRLLDVLKSLVGHRLKKEGVKLIIGQEIEFINICSRESELLHIFVNLINNSCDATSELAPEDKWIKISGRLGKGRIEILVSDGGSTPSIEKQVMMFRDFYTSKEKGKGTGLGLGIVIRLLKRQDAEIYLDEKSKNTCFILSFPTGLETNQND